MDWKKNRQAKGQPKSAKAANFDPKAQVSDTIDARPYGEMPLQSNASPQPVDRRSIQDTKIYKDSMSGLRYGWNNYVQLLKNSFNRMPRANQEALITRFSMIITIGVSIIMIIFFYPFLPLFLRVIGVPLGLAAAWWAGTRIVGPVMIVRYEEHLNREF
jgi:hypothetical protein